ncbi:MAG TPA: 1-deoxy-D-xylulose-5-phosphate reductoisomerase [Fimbriimonadaceae bacterium]|nr:1-deoxy-D-xylulose-5-phosphate reductoisomerase [Fimbriimonadaceae bacterium]HRJ31949.1 1-deoxy-D-xylulose-5-phosphate reductoisomerase [Fimbriimonadaceae bacterium]
MKRVVVLGSTGSIGTQTLDIARQLPDQIQIVGLAAHRQGDKLWEQAQEFGVRRLALFDADAPAPGPIPRGMSAILDLVTGPEVDAVVVSVAGVIGLQPTLAAIDAGKQICLASKEVLVAAGEIVMPRVRASGQPMTPIDSEHSAIFQCLLGSSRDDVARLILTASGGPFRGKSRSELESISPQQALNHPTWNMGGKITIDSATLMNKGLEMIEAMWLFEVSIDQVDVVLHPQSIVHSFVEFQDGSVLGQLGWPNMRLPIQFALVYPQRLTNQLPRWSPLETPNLTFEAPDPETFRSLVLAREAARIGQTMPCALNAANEWAANAFLRGEIRFLQIPEVVERVMWAHQPVAASLESLLEVDQWARREAESLAMA